MEDDLNMDDETPETTGEAEALAATTLDPQATLASLSQRYSGLMGEQKAAREKAEAARAARFKAAEEAIKQQRFGAPSTSEKLYALSAALLSPRRMPGIAGTLNNLVPTLSKMAQLQSGAESQREAALRQLREQYEVAGEESLLAGLEGERKAISEQMRVLGPLAKPPAGAGRFAVSANPITGVETYKNFAVPVAAVNALLYALQTPGATEQQKADTIAAFERKYKVSAETFIEGLR